MGRRRRKYLHLRGVELTRFALFYCSLVREILSLQVGIIYCMFSVYSITGTVAKNKQASDWVGAEENMPPIGTLEVNILISVWLS